MEEGAQAIDQRYRMRGGNSSLMKRCHSLGLSLEGLKDIELGEGVVCRWICRYLRNEAVSLGIGGEDG